MFVEGRNPNVIVVLHSLISMRILLANKFYYRRGGDCVCMLNTERLLKEHGHEVAVFAMDYPENMYTPWSVFFPKKMETWMALTRPFGSYEVRRKFKALLDFFRPEVVHLNNIHTQLSPVVGEMAHRRGIKVVWTLHDYKLLCPRYDCLRGGKIVCEACFDGNKLLCLKHKCLKDSILASWIGYWEACRWNRRRLEEYTDLFVCPSRFMADKMTQGGFEKSKLVVLHNFIDGKSCFQDDYGKEDYYCFVGRLSHEKGVETLLKAAASLPYRLKVIGGGPLADYLQKKYPQGCIEFLGFRPWNELKRLVRRARFSVLPSEWNENNPLSVIEALGLGTPVLGARIGGIPELIDDGVNGQTFESGNVDDLRGKIQEMWNSVFEYRRIAQNAKACYGEGTYYDRLMKIYQ